RTQNAELRTAIVDTNELSRLQYSHQGLLRLRGEVRTLRESAEPGVAERAHEQARKEQEALEKERQFLEMVPASAQCIRNLEKIQAAKKMLVKTGVRLSPEVAPRWEDLKVYDPELDKLICPSGGHYSINPIEKPPGCSIPAHGEFYP